MRRACSCGLAISLASLLLLACRTTSSAEDPGRLQHTAGELVTVAGAFDYLDWPRSEYTSRTIGPFFSADHQVTIYLQDWLDRFDQLLRTEFPDQLAGVPAPQAAVRRVAETGAFTAGSLRRCYEVDVRISPEIMISPSTTLTGITAKPGQISPSGMHNCPRIDVPAEQYPAMAQWFSKKYAPCRLEYGNASGGAGQLLMTGPCREQDFFPTKALAKGIETKVAPNWILTFAGTLLLFDHPDELAAVIAHELAHYYRAHVVHQHDRYGFCYRVDEESQPFRPVPDPELKELCDKMRIDIDFDPAAAAAAKLGYYTIEQEADDLGLEILALAGVDPEVAIAAFTKLGLAREASHPPGAPAIPMSECLQLRSQGWRNDLGFPVFVPVGDYEDIHHSWCYRLRNIDRELAAHQYDVATTSPLPRSLERWQANRAAIEAALAP